MNAEQAQERISAALDAIDAAHHVLRETSSDVVGNDFRLDVADRLETQHRTNRGLKQPGRERDPAAGSGDERPEAAVENLQMADGSSGDLAGVDQSQLHRGPGEFIRRGGVGEVPGVVGEARREDRF